MPIIECVPNFSEGRDLSVLERIAQAITAVPNVKLLDHSADRDHNRSVYTFIGYPEAVLEAAFRSAQCAKDLLDIKVHAGAHPRTGVIDVIPFIPVKDSSLLDCAVTAERLGQRLRTELDIPSAYYGFKPIDRSTTFKPSLPELRELSRLGKLQTHPTAGTVAIGVRNFMVAYNIDLATADLTVAKTIAGKIRSANGGLPYVRALGFALASRGIVQVSMNLLRPDYTTPQIAYAAVKTVADSLGVQIQRAELIGLLPEQVMAAAGAF
ncbi:MAG: glutamate formimidoyltransferase [Candidatus Margulisiibacteriota bacterium]|jgi:glutamate formiminotransferase